MAIPRSPDEAGGPSLRVRRVAEAIKGVASRVITQELSDPRMGFVTVTRVELTRDLREARILVSVLGGDADRNKTLAALTHAAGFVKRRCSDELNMRYTPKIKIEFDEGIDKSIRVSELLYEGKQGGPPEKLPPMVEEEETE